MISEVPCDFKTRLEWACNTKLRPWQSDLTQIFFWDWFKLLRVVTGFKPNTEQQRSSSAPAAGRERNLHKPEKVRWTWTPKQRWSIESKPFQDVCNEIKTFKLSIYQAKLRLRWGDGFETPGCGVHPLYNRLVWMKIETPLALSEGMEKRGPDRVNCRPLKDINAYAGGSSLFLLRCCPALPIFYMNESVKW